MGASDFNKVFSKRLNYYLNIYDMTQLDLAKRLGVGTTSVSNWCRGIKSPRMDKVDTMCEIFHCSRSDLMEENNSLHERRKGVIINVLGTVPAGVPIEAVEDIIDTEEISQEMAATGDFFGLRVKGHSMEPRIREGDVLIVRQQNDADDGDVVIALVNGNEATCKRLKKYKDGIRLMPDNPSYEPLYFTNEEIETAPVTILGKAVENRQKNL